MTKTKVEIASESKFAFIVKEIKRYRKQVSEAIANENVQLIAKLKSELTILEDDLKNSYFGVAEESSEQLYDSFTQAKDIVIDDLVKIETFLVTQVVNTQENKNKIDNSGIKDNSLKLPKFELPVFYGDLGNWITFKETFLTAIHKNDSLSDQLKFSYLVASVKNYPAKLISGFSISGENYKQAWETLVNRYDNRKNLAYSLLAKFMNAKPLKSPTQKTILELLDTCNEVVRNFKSLKFEFNEFVHLILVYIVQTKFDDSLRKQWELSLNNDSFPTYEMLISFLEKHARSLQGCHNEFAKVEPKSNKFDFKSQHFSKKSVSNTVLMENVNKSKHLCPQCNESHALFKCPLIQNLTVDQRWQLVKSKKLCANCLRPNHFVANCLVSATCKHCNLRHHSLLHSDQSVPASQNSSRVYDRIASSNSGNNSNNQSNESNCLSSQTSNGNSQTLLSTAIIHVKSKSGESIPCRAMIDSASQKSLLSKSCCKKLGLPLRPTIHKISGINNLVAETALQEVSLTFSPYFSNETFQLDALVVNQITTNLPNFFITTTNWPHIEGLNLADPTFHVSSPIDVLIGADLFANIIIGESILGPKGSPSAVNSRLGWILSGIIYSNYSTENSSVSCHVTTQIDTQLQKFWELESVPTVDPISLVEDNYAKTVSRTESGRYIVHLPFKSKPVLGNSKSQALRRFNFLENKLKKNPLLKEQYFSFMQEYIDLGHMKLVPESEISNSDHFYLPHHGVLKEDSSTTKLRVVFDASAVGSEGRSLNNYLEIGPKLQPEIFNLLLKFRTYPIAFSADIEKMFRQILVTPEHLDYQRIIWRFDSKDSFQTYRLLTVTYGTACAPFLAIRTLHELAKDNEHHYKEVANIIRDNIYVDDVLSGANSIQTAQTLINELIIVMQNGGFNLRKWTCNVPEVIAHLPAELKASSQKVDIQNDETVKVLGLFWDSNKDTLQIHFNDLKEVKTKRDLLSVVATIFDPLGFLSPTTIQLKIMLQDLWRDKISWDEEIPDSILQVWKKFASEIFLLKSIQIPRYINVYHSSNVELQLHGFSDGSGKAYAAVTYLRIITPTDIYVNLIAAKTKVNPIKQQTLPRIELCSALLLAKLCSVIIDTFPRKFTNIFMWSDSQIVISWLKSPPLKGNQFVQNRVTQIKTLVPTSQWNHIPGTLNPADIASRGISPRKLIHHSLWWHGPPWLLSNDPIPIPSYIPPIAELDQTAESVTNITQVKRLPDFILKFSKFSKLSRVIAWCRRFIYNAKNSTTKRTGTLNAKEISDSIHVIVKLVQLLEFPTELKLLKERKPLPNNCKLLSLNVFLDSNGIIRVGGRLSEHQTLNFDAKFPMLLPNNHALTKLLIKHVHEQHLHAGTQLVLSILRQQYWFVNGRSTVRQELHKCVLCKRLKSQVCQQLMGNLPVDRITPMRPFLKVGVDFAGPFFTKPNVSRSKVKIKSYLSVFVCMCTKALHLELVSDLSVQALLAAFKRFIARRGLPADVYSDNGKNFTGLANQLKQLYKYLRENEVQEYITARGINWHFIPPYAPHFGGLWEAAVKLTKNHLLKACKSSILNFEEISTLLCQIESCINSRPLMPMSSDPSDPRALTPGHFLIGAPLLEIPTCSNSQALHLNARWRLIEQAKYQFWCRWSRDYLQNLQQRPKWTTARSNLKEGDIVIIHDRCQPMQWKLGRILETFPGSDNLVRVVRIKTADGEIKRPISKVSSLFPGAEDVQLS